MGGNIVGWNPTTQTWTAVPGGSGVVDGSDAPAGAVGEYLVVSSNNPGGQTPTNPAAPYASFAADNVHHPIAALGLTPGDWSVGATVDSWMDVPPPGPLIDHFWVYLGQPMTVDYGQADTATDVGIFGIEYTPGVGQGMFNGTATVGPIRISTAVPTQAVLAVQVGSDTPGLPAGATYTIWARRMR
jgi:hypothetical protein